MSVLYTNDYKAIYIDQLSFVKICLGGGGLELALHKGVYCHSFS